MDYFTLRVFMFFARYFFVRIPDSMTFL